MPGITRFSLLIACCLISLPWATWPADLPEPLVRKLTGATVYIETQLILAASDWEGLTPEQRAALGKRPHGPASGSGFLISRDGLILTNAHVIDTYRQTVPYGPKREPREWRFNPSSVKVVVRSGMPGERTYLPKIIRMDSGADLALLRIPPQADLEPLTLKPWPLAEAGQQAFMSGFPGGKIPDLAPFAGSAKTSFADAKNPRASLNAGMVTAIRENHREVCYQLDIRANPGNSGGPIVNAEGEVIGILNAGISSMQSINYAIPAMVLKRILPATLTESWPKSAGESQSAQPYDEFKASGSFRLGH